MYETMAFKICELQTICKCQESPALVMRTRRQIYAKLFPEPRTRCCMPRAFTVVCRLFARKVTHKCCNSPQMVPIVVPNT